MFYSTQIYAIIFQEPAFNSYNGKELLLKKENMNWNELESLHLHSRFQDTKNETINHSAEK